MTSNAHGHCHRRPPPPPPPPPPPQAAPGGPGVDARRQQQQEGGQGGRSAGGGAEAAEDGGAQEDAVVSDVFPLISAVLRELNERWASPLREHLWMTQVGERLSLTTALCLFFISLSLSLSLSRALSLSLTNCLFLSHPATHAHCCPRSPPLPTLRARACRACALRCAAPQTSGRACGRCWRGCARGAPLPVRALKGRGRGGGGASRRVRQPPTCKHAHVGAHTHTCTHACAHTLARRGGPFHRRPPAAHARPAHRGAARRRAPGARGA